ncbi:hypothetical protein [Metabacillus fastidiosus]|uniref:hypothetical protein n=1 Tax=Metabacillus fastidiosus TaxID=1458 RepID=UPI003D29292B
MDFIQYLQMRHHKHGDQEWNLMKYGIYKGETSITPEINEKIGQKYVNACGEYERTIKYYLGFLKLIRGNAEY